MIRFKRCPRCYYDLRFSEQGSCPECGLDLRSVASTIQDYSGRSVNSLHGSMKNWIWLSTLILGVATVSLLWKTQLSIDMPFIVVVYTVSLIHDSVSIRRLDQFIALSFDASVPQIDLTLHFILKRRFSINSNLLSVLAMKWLIAPFVLCLLIAESFILFEFLNSATRSTLYGIVTSSLLSITIFLSHEGNETR